MLDVGVSCGTIEAGLPVDELGGYVSGRLLCMRKLLSV